MPTAVEFMWKFPVAACKVLSKVLPQQNVILRIEMQTTFMVAEKIIVCFSWEQNTVLEVFLRRNAYPDFERENSSLFSTNINTTVPATQVYLWVWSPKQ